MADKILIVPGYGGIETRIEEFKKNPYIFIPGVTGLLNQNDIEIYTWPISDNLPKLFQIIDVYRLYRKQFIDSSDEFYINHLIRKINEVNPTIIIANSIGAPLLLKAIEKMTKLGIKSIIFTQADFDRNTKVPDYLNKINLINTFCPWDDMLFLSMIIHWYIPAGLYGWKKPNVKNIFQPLYKKIPLHFSNLSSKSFCKKIMKLINYQF